MEKQEREVLLFLEKRKQDYTNTFNKEQEHSREVLKDLAKFCRVNESTFHPDQRVHALQEGRREVFLRILDHLKMTPKDLVQKYANRKIKE